MTDPLKELLDIASELAAGRSLEGLERVSALHGRKIHADQIRIAMRIRQAVNEFKDQEVRELTLSTEEADG